MSTTAAATATPFEAQPTLAHLDADCFCEACSYSLRGQPVREEPRTRVLMVRCPECGRFTPAAAVATAGRMWLGRLVTWLTMMWVGAAAVAIVGEMLLGLGLLEWLADSIRRMLRSGSRSEALEYTLPEFIAALGAIFALAFASAVMGSVVFPHWRRWGYAASGIGRAALIALAAAGLSRLGHDPNHRFAELAAAMLFFPVQSVAACLGGVLGRPMARGWARLVLPRRWRAAAAYLWTVDGREPPGVVKAG